MVHVSKEIGRYFHIVFQYNHTAVFVYRFSNATYSGSAIAQLLSVTLYGRRFFPFYAFCMIAGVDEQGEGAVYGYDAVGSFKRDK
ncbi:MAG: hypothetical protein EOO89_17275 [Pedobacter sp.]|nr:MAG: hypothetical protein EOO89_17275 [Pedobacter sp.]